MSGVCGSCNYQCKTVTPEILELLGLLPSRGQDSLGLATTDSRKGDEPTRHWKELGPPDQWFSRKTGGPLVRKLLRELRGDVGIGHVQQATTSLLTSADAQPHYCDRGGKKIVVANDGGIPFCARERNRLKHKGYPFASCCNAEVFAKLIGDHLWTHHGTEEDAFMQVGRTLSAAYSLVAIMPSKRLFAMRDPHGFHPLWYVENSDGFHVSSESHIISGFGQPCEVEPGTFVTVEVSGKVEARRFARKPIRRCLMGYYYVTRPDAISDCSDGTIDEIRFQLGRRLAQEIKAAGYPPPEVVIPVPFSGISAATGCAAELRVSLRLGIMKDRYAGRIFLQDERARSTLVQQRFAINPQAVEGRVVVVVDDSIVRGDQARVLVPMLRAAGARVIIYTATAPPHRHPCFYGIGTPNPRRLIAHGKSEEQVREEIGTDYLYYLSLESTFQVLGSHNFCAACFTGDYPLPVPSGGGSKA